MTIEITPENLYAGITCILLLIQVWQYYKLTKLEKEINSIWNQIGTLVTSVAGKLIDIENKIDSKVGKQDKA